MQCVREPLSCGTYLDAQEGRGREVRTAAQHCPASNASLNLVLCAADSSARTAIVPSRRSVRWAATSASATRARGDVNGVRSSTRNAVAKAQVSTRQQSRSTQHSTASSHAAALTTHLTPSSLFQGQAGRRLCARRAVADGGMAPLAPLNRMTMGRTSVRRAAGGSSRWALCLVTSAPVIRASGHANGASARSMNAMRRGRGQAARRRYVHRAARDGSKARPDRLSAMKMVNTYARRARRSSTRSAPWAVIGASATLVSGGVDGATAWLPSAMVRAPVQTGRRRCAQRALRDSVRGIPPRHYGTTAATSYAIRARRPSLLWGPLAAIAASARSSRTPLRHA